MGLPNLVILDVGHGNCAVLSDGDEAFVVDAACRETLLMYLETRGITQIAAVLISHADADHIAGVMGLLLCPSIKVERIYVNPDSIKKTEIWTDFRYTIAEVRRAKGTVVHTELTTTNSPEFSRKDYRIEVLSPTPEVAMAGVGSVDLEERSLSPNAMSAVIRILSTSGPEALLPGDIDAVGLSNLLRECPQPCARILVFPHHGGVPRGADEYGFARDLCQAVKPSVVVFSIGRGKHDTPRPQIVRGVRAGAPDAYIACTQLSMHCAASLPHGADEHLGDRPSRGRVSNSCCAGSIEFSLGAEPLSHEPSAEAHSRFIEMAASSALCRRWGSARAFR